MEYMPIVKRIFNVYLYYSVAVIAIFGFILTTRRIVFATKGFIRITCM